MTAVALLVFAGSAGLGAPAAPAIPPAARPVRSAAEETGTVFARAGAAYEAGRFAEARELWLGMVSGGHLTPAVGYNLGNTWFRLGERGRAVLWYERARRLAPRDEDIRFNLALARAGIEGEEAGFGEWLDRFVAPRELAWAAAFLFWLICGLAGWALWRGLAWERIGAPLLTAVMLLAFTSGWLWAREAELRAPWGVVIRPSVEVRSGPGDQFPVGFTAPAGRRALLLSRRPGWVEIGVPSQSLKGWAPEDAVEKL